MTVVGEPLQVGDPEWVGRYRVLARLGAGGMGRVHLTESPDGMRVALKVVRDDLADDTGSAAGSGGRWRRPRPSRECSPPACSAPTRTATRRGWPPIRRGPDSARRRRSARSAARARRPRPRGGLAEALAAIHAAGLVHRDLKPANVLLSPSGPRVIDFGIARAADASRLTGTGQVMGTPSFMAPEQIEGTHDSGPPADVFALGATLVFAACGSGPFDADHAAAAFYRILNRPADLGRTPPQVGAIVASCLEKDPAARPTAVQLAVALRDGAAVRGAQFGAVPAGAPVAAPSGRRGGDEHAVRRHAGRCRVGDRAVVVTLRTCR